MDGRELSVVFAKDRRKTADEMRPVSRQRGDSRERGGGGGRFERGGRDSRDRGRNRRLVDVCIGTSIFFNIRISLVFRAVDPETEAGGLTAEG